MKKILVCHTGAWIGDMVLLTPTLRVLKEYYPNSHLTMLLRSQVADLMRVNPYVDSCMIDDKQDGFFTSLIRLTKTVKNENFHICIVLHPTSYRNTLIPFFARVPKRIGSNYRLRGIFLTSSCPDTSRKHEVNRYLSVLNLLQELSVYISTYIRNPDLEFWHTDVERSTVKKILKNKGVTEKDRVIAVNIGTTWQTKQWDVKNIGSVISEVSNRLPNIKILITGSVAEQIHIERLPNVNAAINLVGQTSILQLGALLERCELCVTCDSGPMHIAAAVGTPCIALFGPTDPVRHKPFGNGHTIIEQQVSCRPCYKRTCQRMDSPNLCMNKINTKDVIDAILNVLNHQDSEINRGKILDDSSIGF